MDYKIQLNIKSICLAEHLLGKPYTAFDYENESEYTALIFAMISVNNDVVMTFDDFKRLIENQKLKSKIFIDAEKCLSASLVKPLAETNEESQIEQSEVYMSELAGLLITNGYSPEYVMKEMGLWEMKSALKSVDMRVRQRMEESRFWAFWNVAPHAKIKTPQDLVVFDWEIESMKKNAENAIDRDIKRFEEFMSLQENQHKNN